MATGPTGIETAIWTDPERAGMVSAILERMGDAIRPIAVGGSRATPVSQLADSLGLRSEDDARKMLIDHPAAFLLLAGAGVKRDTITHAVAQGTVVLAVEPAADALESLATPVGKNTSAPAGRIITLPAFDRSPGWASAADPAQVLGRLHSLSLASLGHAAECSLFARLYDAWHTLLALTPLPESIDASIVGAGDEPPDDLRAIAGNLSAHARLPGGSAIILQLSDRAGEHERRLRILGDQGSLLVSDLTYRLTDPVGKILDSKSGTAPDGNLFADMIAKQWARLLDRPEAIPPTPPAQSEPRVLACCLASLLSARTAQPESPTKLLSVHGLG
ncbi:MAG: hypothetical protein K8S99_03425 [Planctomycetes bacterium]|nr:hypothetical protein [Planctomycetota bacterium]